MSLYRPLWHKGGEAGSIDSTVDELTLNNWEIVFAAPPNMGSAPSDIIIGDEDTSIIRVDGLMSTNQNTQSGILASLNHARGGFKAAGGRLPANYTIHGQFLGSHADAAAFDARCRKMSKIGLEFGEQYLVRMHLKTPTMNQGNPVFAAGNFTFNMIFESEATEFGLFDFTIDFECPYGVLQSTVESETLSFLAGQLGSVSTPVTSFDDVNDVDIDFVAVITGPWSTLTSDMVFRVGPAEIPQFVGGIPFFVDEWTMEVHIDKPPTPIPANLELVVDGVARNAYWRHPSTTFPSLWNISRAKLTMQQWRSVSNVDSSTDVYTDVTGQTSGGGTWSMDLYHRKAIR